MDIDLKGLKRPGEDITGLQQGEEEWNEILRNRGGDGHFT